MSKFKKGDKVKVIKLKEVSFIVEIGDIGIVENIDEENKYPIRVKINNEEDYGFKEDELEVVNGTCKLMKRLEEVDEIDKLSYESIEQIKRIICGTHNGICSEKYYT